jgi:hypothetical protein
LKASYASTWTAWSSALDEAHETARVRFAWAALLLHGVCGARAAGGDAGGWISALGVSSKLRELQVNAFREGLANGGLVEGRNVTIEYHWAESQLDRLPTLAADIVRRRVSAIAACGSPTARWRPNRQPHRFQ